MISLAVQRLIDYGVRTNLITIDDVYVVRNRLMEALSLTEWEECSQDSLGMSIDDVLSPLVEYAIERGIIPDSQGSRDLFDTRLMGILTPMPREVIRNFEELYEISPESATDHYYRMSRDLNYVRGGRIERDLKWTYDSEYGTLDITVNRSKPEKDPRDIALSGQTKSSSYPKCQLCIENSGFPGHKTHPARQNLVPIPITVDGEKWAFQYSPYGYYNEHCIVFNTKHIPMKIDSSVFDKLLDIVDYLPHYFVGSNADLPIVGGSILSHEHFQGGKYTFPMEKSSVEHEFTMKDFPNVRAGIVKWPMSVIRLSSADRREISLAGNHLLEKWRGYTDPSVNIYSETSAGKHSTVTPIARKQGEEYTLDIVLRNNITTEDRPLGLFHPSPKLHHIKKENIGLIEVMGLAVLPARLAYEIAEIESAIVRGERVSDIPSISSHGEWAEGVIASHPELSPENANDILKQEIGKVFLEVLFDAGVFKRDENGKKAFLRFVNSL